MPLPKFLGIGAPRSGTRWLAQCLAEHPEVSLPPEEVYFFTTRRVVHSFWERGVEWYEQLLAQSMKAGAATWGEVTPVYLLDDDTPARVHKIVPDVKLICLLREQSERAYSWYRFFLKVNPDLYSSDYSFKRFLTYHTEVYGGEGYYLDLIERYLAYFPRDSLLILLYDDLLKSPLSVIRNVYEFLGVDTAFVPPSGEKRINDAPMLRAMPLRLETLTKQEERGVVPKHTLDPEMRARMHRLYEDHNRRLGGFLGRDLSPWNSGLRAPDR